METKHHALLYALIAKYCILYAKEEEGTALIRKITVAYGHQRGKRMRQKSLENQEPASMQSFLIHGEWQGKPGENSSEMFYEEDCTVSKVYRCAWYDTWQKYGLKEYGTYYCRFIDRAIAEGFDGGFELEVPQTIGSGSDSCRFIWNAPVQENVIRNEKRKAQGKWILPFDFHCRELYRCAEQFLPEEVMADIRKQMRLLAPEIAYVDWLN